MGWGTVKNSEGKDVRVYIPGKQEAYESAGDTRYDKKAHESEMKTDSGKGYKNLTHKAKSKAQPGSLAYARENKEPVDPYAGT